MLSQEQLNMIVHEAAEEASNKAVKDVFAILGVNIDEPHEVASFQDDLRFGRRLRKAADHSWLAFVGAVTLFLVGAIGLGFRKLVLGD